MKDFSSFIADLSAQVTHTEFDKDVHVPTFTDRNYFIYQIIYKFLVFSSFYLLVNTFCYI